MGKGGLGRLRTYRAGEKRRGGGAWGEAGMDEKGKGNS